MDEITYSWVRETNIDLTKTETRDILAGPIVRLPGDIDGVVVDNSSCERGYSSPSYYRFRESVRARRRTGGSQHPAGKERSKDQGYHFWGERENGERKIWETLPGATSDEESLAVLIDTYTSSQTPHGRVRAEADHPRVSGFWSRRTGVTGHGRSLCKEMPVPLLQDSHIQNAGKMHWCISSRWVSKGDISGLELVYRSL